MELKKQKVLFLDRDGTICFDDGAFGSEKIPYDKCIEMTRPLDGSVSTCAEIIKNAIG